MSMSDAFPPQVIVPSANHLLHKADIFDKARRSTLPFPLTRNRINETPVQLPYNEVVENANNVRPIAHPALKTLLAEFLDFKRKYGTDVERRFYADVDKHDLIDRLLCKRPLAFLNSSDMYMLRDHTRGRGGFDSIGTAEETAPLVLADYMSYDEIALAALVGVSTPTHFINSGKRDNMGNPATVGSYEPCGVYVGLVGARFEREELMEWRHMLVTVQQNTKHNGYGAEAIPDAVATRALEPWAKFYGAGAESRWFFPSYEEAREVAERQEDAGVRRDEQQFVEVKQLGYLNCDVFRKRMRAVLEPFLLDANERAFDKSTSAYVHMVGLGIGVWAIDKGLQEALLVQAVAQILESQFLPNVSDIDFSYFDYCRQCGGVGNGAKFTKKGNNITMHFSKRDPAAKLDGKKLLVAAFAWDGNAFPGNEYWLGNLAASGDPAAMACSFVAELGNPLINDKVSARYMKYFGNEELQQQSSA